MAAYAGFVEDERTKAITAFSNLATGTFTMLGWIDPVGQWWVAPLGTRAPDLDKPMPPEWIPMKRAENVR